MTAPDIMSVHGALLWNDGNYYLIGYDHDTQVKDIRHYRVDKMKNILIENKVREGREKL